MIIRPQEGPQEMFAASNADIAIFGGAAGGGKSWVLLLDPVRFVDRKGFGGVIFRRTYGEITNEGGLWDTSDKIYGHTEARPVQSSFEWRWPNGVTIAFSHMQHEKHKKAWQGAALPFIGFDELTHFTRGQFFYMMSRNRLTHDCGVDPYIRATCNPDPDSWVAEFISWWIDQETGFPIPERAGKLRWFIRDGDLIVWADDPKKLENKLLGIKPKSVTFVPSKLSDNKILMKQDPAYLSNLYALPLVERMRLLEGNWKVRAVQGTFFRRPWFGKTIEMPELLELMRLAVRNKVYVKILRYWDRAATEASSASPDPDWTAGVKGVRIGTSYFVIDVKHFRGRPEAVLRVIKDTAKSDGVECEQVFEEDPGSAGKAEIAMFYRELSGHHVSAVRVTKKKVVRARPASSQVEAGNVRLVRAPWNEGFLTELEGFADWDTVETPPPVLPHDDQVDAFSGMFTALANTTRVGSGHF